MKPIFSNPELIKLTLLLEEYEGILQAHAQAKVISLSEHRKIIEEMRQVKQKFIDMSIKALQGYL